MDENIKLLKILNPTNNSIFMTKKSILARINDLDELNDLGERFFEKNVVNQLDIIIKSLNSNIYRLLMQIPIYIDFLSYIKVLNVYDCSDLLLEINDINRFKTFGAFLSYSGFAPNKKGNQKLYKILLRISNKLRRDRSYQIIYSIYFDEYKEKHPNWDEKGIEVLANKKMMITFLKRLYKVWKIQENDK